MAPEFYKNLAKTVRVNTFLDGISSGVNSTEVLDKMVEVSVSEAFKKKGEETDKLGRESVENYLRIVRDGLIPHISGAFLATSNEDNKLGNDVWTVLSPDAPKPKDLSVRMFQTQIKSSSEYVKKFKSHKAFRKYGGVIAVINANPARHDNEIIEEAQSEYDRVLRNLAKLRKRHQKPINSKASSF